MVKHRDDRIFNFCTDMRATAPTNSNSSDLLYSLLELGGEALHSNPDLSLTLGMAPESAENSNNNRVPLYTQFEGSLEKLENKKSSLDVEKSLWKKLNLHFLSIRVPPSSSSTKNEKDQPQNNQPSSSNPETRELTRKSSSLNKNEEDKPRNNQPSSSNNREFFREISKPSRGSSKVYGFENQVSSLETMLLKSGSDDEFKAVGVVGIAGVGKTALCQEFFNKEEVKRHFVPRIWVCMSRQQDSYKNSKAEIIKRMLACLGVDDEIINPMPKEDDQPPPKEDDQLSGLVYALHLELITKKYLIVLDDCEETDTWYEKLSSCSINAEKWGEKLHHGFPKGYGGAVIVTSRNEQVAKEMVGEENLLQLLPLSDPESCWSIYKDSVVAERVEFNEQDSQQLKEQLKRKCGGLPLAAKLMGQIKAKQVPEAATRNTDE